jgi:methyl-coenzyme M reductase alpha subunit
MTGVSDSTVCTAAYYYILDNNVYYDVDYINDKYNGAAEVCNQQGKATHDVVKDIATESHSTVSRLREVPDCP